MLTITLPFPAPELFPNRVRGHWAKISGTKAKAVADAFAVTHQAVHNYRGEALTGDIPLTLTFCPPDKRHRDLDGCLSACKQMLDGVALALKVNDKRFSPITILRGGTTRPPCVVVQIGGKE